MEKESKEGILIKVNENDFINIKKIIRMYITTGPMLDSNGNFMSFGEKRYIIIVSEIDIGIKVNEDTYNKLLNKFEIL